VNTPAPICPTCDQPGTLALAAPTEQWECRNEACPEFGQVLDPNTDRQQSNRKAPASGLDAEKS
jgi:hypothetical protein